jgi:hypothetical protein
VTNLSLMAGLNFQHVNLFGPKEMTMSRKDFELIAKHISEIADRNTRVEAATAVAAACMKINTRFNITKFYEACNVLL